MTYTREALDRIVDDFSKKEEPVKTERPKFKGEDPNLTNAHQLLSEAQAKITMLIERTTHSNALELLCSALKDIRKTFSCLEDDGNGPEFFR